MKRILILALLTLGLVLSLGPAAMAKFDVTVDPWGSFEVGVPVKDKIVGVVGVDFWSEHRSWEESDSDTSGRIDLLLGARYYLNTEASVKPYAFGKLVLDFDDQHEDWDIDSEWGLNAGLGLEKEIVDNFSLVGEVGVWCDYTNYTDDESYFGTHTDATIGLKFYL